MRYHDRLEVTERRLVVTAPGYDQARGSTAPCHP
jgi:hypothetical protein